MIQKKIFNINLIASEYDIYNFDIAKVSRKIQKDYFMKKFEIKYCKKCVTPNTRPDIDFDRFGICSACNNHIAKKTKINWKKRLIEFRKILNRHKNRTKPFHYNCIVPVSGGKDSIYQTYVMKKIFKMNLLRTFRPLSRTYK